MTIHLIYIKAVEKAINKEQSQSRKDAIGTNFNKFAYVCRRQTIFCAKDTAIVTCFVKFGYAVQWDRTDMTRQEMVDEGTRRAYFDPDYPLRASIVSDPAG